MQSLNSNLCIDGLVMQLTQVCCYVLLVSSSDIVIEIHSAAAKHVEAIYILSERNMQSGNMRGRRNTSG